MYLSQEKLSWSFCFSSRGFTTMAVASSMIHRLTDLFLLATMKWERNQRMGWLVLLRQENFYSPLHGGSIFLGHFVPSSAEHKKREKEHTSNGGPIKWRTNKGLHCAWVREWEWTRSERVWARRFSYEIMFHQGHNWFSLPAASRQAAADYMLSVFGSRIPQQYPKKIKVD